MSRLWAERSCAAEGCCSEQEVDNLENAMHFMLTYKRELPILVLTADMILDFHRQVLRGSIHAGKIRDCYVETVYNGEKHIYPSPEHLETHLQSICDAYNKAIFRDVQPTTALVAWLIFNFLSLHPFHDGNGRTARVLAAYCLDGVVVQNWVDAIVTVRKTVDLISFPIWCDTSPLESIFLIMPD